MHWNATLNTHTQLQRKTRIRTIKSENSANPLLKQISTKVNAHKHFTLVICKIHAAAHTLSCVFLLLFLLLIYYYYVPR